MANSRTKARIEARIRERVAYCFEFELNDPRASFTTVTKAEISSDLSVAKVFYTVFGADADKRKVALMLVDATGFIRKQLGRVLRTRRIPRLTWIYDDSVEIAESMNSAIARAIEQDRKINPDAHTDLAPQEEAFEEDEEEPEEEAIDREYLDYLRAREAKEGDDT